MHYQTEKKTHREKKMGLNFSSGERLPGKPYEETRQNEFLIKLKHPSQILDVCAALENQQCNVHAVNESEGYIWIEPTPDVKLSLENSNCLGFDTQPHEYVSKGTHVYQLQGEGRTAFNLKRAIENFEQQGFRVSAHSSPVSFRQPYCIYFS